MPPTVSVIIPCYNGSGTIKQTINSVRRQSYNTIEIIVIDDGSNDDSLYLINSINDSRIVLLENDENKGIPATRNRGIQEAKGEYICFLDQDDIWLSKKLEYQIEAIDSKSKVGVVYSRLYLMDKDGQPFALRNPDLPPDKNPGKKCYFSNFRIPMTTKLFRKKCIDSVGLMDESLYGADDHDLDIRILTETKYKYKYIDTPLALKRQTTENASGNYEEMLKDELYLAEKHAHRFKNPQKNLRKKKSRIYTHRAINYLNNGEKIDAASDIFAAISKDLHNWKAYGLIPSLCPRPFGSYWFQFLKIVKNMRSNDKYITSFIN